MSNTVDKKVVEMQFDNRQFEANVKQSMNTLDKLNNSLKMTESAKGLEEVKKASEKVTFNEMSDSLDTVKAKFSALQIIGITTISRLTNNALDAAKKIKNYTIGAITQGGKTRALNIEQAKFQFEGLKMNVKKSMESALKAVQGTAYGLDEAANVASQFGASGIKAGKEMTKSLRGVAGLAAMTSSSYSDIGRIFTQTAGQGRLMGDQLLQISQRGINAAATISKFLNKSEKDANRVRAAMAASNKKDMQAMSKQMKFTEADIRAMVSGGVIDFKTFSNAMDDAFGQHAKDANKTFTGSMANVRAALSRIGADFYSPILKNEGPVVKLLNSLIPIIDGIHESATPLINYFSKKSSKIIGSVTKFFKQFQNKDGKVELEGLTKAFKSLVNVIKGGFNILKAFGSVLSPIKNAFKDVFSLPDISNILNFTKQFKKFTKTLTISDETADKLRRTFRGIFSLVGLVINTIKNMISALTGLDFGNGKFIGNILDATAKFGDFLTKFSDKNKDVKSFGKSIDIVNTILKKFRETLSKIGSGLNKFINFVSVQKAIDILKSLLNVLKSIVKFVSEKVSEIFSSTNTDMFVGMGILTVLFYKLRDIKWAIERFASIIGNLKISAVDIKDVLNGVRSSVLSFNRKMKAETLRTTAISIAILAGALFLLSSIDEKKLVNAITAITVLFGELMGTLSLFDKMNGKGLKGVGKYTKLMTSLSFSVLLLSIAFKKLASVDDKGLTRGITAIGALLGELVGAVKLMSLGETKIRSVSISIIFLSVAINILALACIKLSKLSWKEIGKGLSAVGGLLAEVTVFLKLTSGSKGAVSSAIGILILSSAMLVLTKVVEKFAKMKWKEIGKGLAAIYGLVAELSILSLASSKMSVSSGLGVIALATALYILSGVLVTFSKMKWKEIGKGLVMLGGALMEVSLATKLMPRDMMVKGVGLIALAAGMLILSNVLSKFSKMKMSEIGKSLLTLGGSLVILAVGLRLIGSSIFGASALIIASTGLLILAGVLKILGSMSIKSIVKGLVALVGSIVSVSLAAALVTPLIPALMLLSVAFTLLGIAALSFGAGLLTTTIALKALADGAKHIIKAFGEIQIYIRKLIPELAKTVAVGLVKTIETILSTLSKSIGPILDSLSVIILKLLDGMEKNVPIIVEKLLDIAVLIIDSVAKKIPKVVSSLVNLVRVLTRSVLVELTKIDITSIIKMAAGFGILLGVLVILDTMKKHVPGALITAGAVGVIMLGMALVFNIISKLPTNTIGIVAAVSGSLVAISAMLFVLGSLPITGALVGIANLGIAIAGVVGILAALGAIEKYTKGELSSLLEGGGNIMEKIGEAIGKFVGGIVKGAAETVFSALPKIGTYLSQFMINAMGFVIGVKMFNKDTYESALNLAKIVILLGIGKIIDAIGNMMNKDYSSVGALEDFGKGMVKYGRAVSKLSKNDIKKMNIATKAAVPITKVLILLGAAKIVNALANIIQEDLTATSMLKDFGQGMVEYGKAVSKLSKNDIKKMNLATKAAEPLTVVLMKLGVAKMVNALANIMQEDLTATSMLKDFGEGMVEYGKAIRELNPLDITMMNLATKAAEPLTYVLIKLGVAEIIDAVAKLLGSDFSATSKLKDFGRGMVEYGKSIRELNANDISKMSDSQAAAEALAGVMIKLGAAEMIDAIANLLGADFSAMEKLKDFGKGVVAYSKEITDLSNSDIEKIGYSADAAQKLSDIANSLPPSSAFWGVFGGDKSLSDFANQLSAFGEGVVSYVTSVKGIEQSDVNKSELVTSMIKTLIEASVLSKDVNSLEFLNVLDTLTTEIPSRIVDMNTALSSVYNSTDQMDGVVETIKKLVAINQVAQTTNADSFNNFATTLPDAAGGIKEFYDILSKDNGIDTAQLSNISESVTEILDYIASSVLKMENAKTNMKSFAKLLPSFAKGIKKYVKTLTGVTTENLNGKTGDIKTFINSISEISTESVEKFIEGFEKSKSEVAVSVTKFLDNARKSASAMESKIRLDFEMIGEFTVDGFIKGINNNTYRLKEAIREMAEKAIKQARETLDVHSPSKVFEKLAKYTIDGYVKGIVKNTNKAVSAVKGSMQKVIKAAKSEMIVGADVAESMAEDILGQFTDQMKNNKLTKKVYKATTAAVSEYAKKLYKKTDNYKTDTQNYNKHTKQLKKAEEDVAKYTKKYNKLSNSNTNALKTNEKQIETLEQKREKAGKKEKKRIDKELKLLKRRNSELKKGADKETKQAKEIDKKLNDAKNRRDEAKASIKQDGKEITQHIKEALNEIINTVKESVQEYTDPLKQSMETGINLFEKYEKQSKISSNRILKNMRSQIKGFSDYKKNLDALKEKGFSVGLRKQLAELGIQGANIVEAFAKMDVSQMAEAEKLFNESNVFAEDMRNYNQNLSFDFVTAWKNGIQQLVDEGLDQETAQKLTEMGVEASAPFIQGLLSGDASTRKKNINKLNQDMKTSKKLSDTIAKAVVGSLATAGSKGVKALKNNVNKNNGKKVGTSICQGLVEGVKGNTGTVSGSCYNLGRAAYEALKKSLKVNSPSKETEFIGENYDNGFIGGIIGKIDDVAKAASKMGNTAIDALSETLSTVPDIVENGINTDMVIKPVLDLSDVDEKSQTLNSMFSRDRAMRISSQINGNMNNTAGGSVNAGNTTTVVNNNYTQNISSPKYLSRIDIYRDTLRIVNQHA